MTTINTLNEKVQKALENVEKRKATVVRHEKQLEKKIKALAKKGCNVENLDLDNLDAVKWDENGKSYDWYWEACDVASKVSDIKGANKKVLEAERVLKNWQDKLEVESQKQQFLNNQAPQVILDFLAKWKENAFNWHVKRYADYKEFVKQLNEEVKQAKESLGIEPHRVPSRAQQKVLKELELDYSSVEKRKANFAGAVVLKMSQYYSEEERLAYLEKTLEKERVAKILDLIERITHVTGTITDATGLRISPQGNLNGIIVGEKSNAKVETIGAGGYNIQCFHYRTLVHELTA